MDVKELRCAVEQLMQKKMNEITNKYYPIVEALHYTATHDLNTVWTVLKLSGRENRLEIGLLTDNVD